MKKTIFYICCLIAYACMLKIATAMLRDCALSREKRDTVHQTLVKITKDGSKASLQ
jgi:hypothetical protein